jgi:hypothetical protein
MYLSSILSTFSAAQGLNFQQLFELILQVQCGNILYETWVAFSLSVFAALVTSL